MAHEFESGFSVKETPWHKLGIVLKDAPSIEEGIIQAGLNWTVSRREVKMINPDGTETIVEGFKAITRDTDNRVFNILGDRYTPLQNDKAFAFFNPFIESGLASLETAGSLRNGTNIWVLAKLNKAPIDVGGSGDFVNKYLLFSNGHDGNMAVRVAFTPIRVVCANTLAMAHASNRANSMIRIFHSSKVQENVEKVQDIVNAIDAKFQATAEQYDFLAKSKVNQKDLKQFVEIVFDLNEERNKLSHERMLSDITKLFETGRGMDLKSANGTYWGLYNAVTEYLSYESGRTDDSRLYSLWFQNAAMINAEALKVAVKMAG